MKHKPTTTCYGWTPEEWAHAYQWYNLYGNPIPTEGRTGLLAVQNWWFDKRGFSIPKGWEPNKLSYTQAHLDWAFNSILNEKIK